MWVATLRKFTPTGLLVQRTFEKDGGSYSAWSPDGRWMAYECGEGTDNHLCVVGAEAGGREQITHEPGQSWVGGWAPDNDTIFFAARCDAVWNVASVSRKARAVTLLTHFTEPRIYVRYPRWDGATTAWCSNAPRRQAGSGL